MTSENKELKMFFGIAGITLLILGTWVILSNWGLFLEFYLTYTDRVIYDKSTIQLDCPTDGVIWYATKTRHRHHQIDPSLCVFRDGGAIINKCNEVFRVRYGCRT